MKSFEELMEIAQSPGNAPENLEKKICDALESAAYIADAKKRRTRIFAWSGTAGLAAAAALALVLIVGKNEPTDTFSDPAEAYTQVEYALNLLSSKISKGMEMAQAPIAEVEQVLEKIK